jgi:hypothetical protein
MSVKKGFWQNLRPVFPQAVTKHLSAVPEFSIVLLFELKTAILFHWIESFYVKK